VAGGEVGVALVHGPWRRHALSAAAHGRAARVRWRRDGDRGCWFGGEGKGDKRTLPWKEEWKSSSNALVLGVAVASERRR
jgi:hypothetical protein